MNAKTDCVMAADNPGSNYEKAIRLGPTVLSVEEIMSLIEGKYK
jgi:NAD-dependent DNA ligase